MDDYNIDFFTTLENECLQTVILHYDFSPAGPDLATRMCRTVKKHVDYVLTESIGRGKALFLIIFREGISSVVLYLQT